MGRRFRVWNNPLWAALVEPSVPEVEVPCPRATLAAMIAAAPFEPKRSGKFTNRTVGSGLAGCISEAWPILAPPGDCASVWNEVVTRTGC